MNNLKLYGDLIAPIYKPVVDAVFNKEYHFITLAGGRSSAKGSTVFTVASMVLANEVCDAFIYAPKYDKIGEKTVEQVKKVLFRLGIEHKVKKQPWSIELFNGSVFHFDGLDATKYKSNDDMEKGVESSKPGGIRFLIFDEIGALRNYDRVNSLIETFIRQPYCQIIEISNPPATKRHPLYKRYQQAEQDPSTLYLHTTIFDTPAEWVQEGEREYIKKLKRTNPAEYNHKYLGIATSTDGLAFNVDDTIWVEPLERSDYLSFWVCTDEATVNATTFCLYGITMNGDYHLINCYYHSSKIDGKKYSPSEYADKFNNWLNDMAVPISQIFTDSPYFAQELRRKGKELDNYAMAKAQSITSFKDRAKSYYLLNKCIMEGRFKIVRDNSNDIFYNQLCNASIAFNSKDEPMVDKSKESGNDNNYHTHALDTALYFCLTQQKNIFKGVEYDR